jgi:CheY-like chemotaxis protein
LGRSSPSSPRCRHADEALRAVRIYKPEVLIIDQDMPTLGGVDVLKQLRVAGNQTPVVLLATSNDPKLMEALASNVEGIVGNRHLLRWCVEVAGRREHGTTRQMPLAVFDDLNGQPCDTVTAFSAVIF